MTTAVCRKRTQAFEAYLYVALGPDLARQAEWSTAGIPTLRDVSVLHRLVVAAGLDPTILLRDLSAPTALERCHGDWRPTLDRLAAPASELSSIAASAAAFDREVAPMALTAGTRRKHQAAWRTVLTWAAAHRALHLILPMSEHTMKALL